jgi:hypothetical protein
MGFGRGGGSPSEIGFGMSFYDFLLCNVHVFRAKMRGIRTVNHVIGRLSWS